MAGRLVNNSAVRRVQGAIRVAAALCALGCAAARAAPHCAETTVRETPYVVCRFDPKADDIRLFHAGPDGEPYRHFGRLNEALHAHGERLLFAMNAGMFQANRAPVGLYVEGGVTRRPINNRDCDGNFCLKPNGVFWLSARGGAISAHVAATEAYLDKAKDVRDATQSGPMLVIDGALHPKFNKDSTSVYRRNGVGVTAEGEIIFAISDAPVTFHAFATLFRDDLKVSNALYLDGAISRLYSTELGRNEPGAALGPIVGVVASENRDQINEGETR
ncbi:MAG: phosphodiester glycosidase family protein [Parvularculaceae bacterium]